MVTNLGYYCSIDQSWSNPKSQSYFDQSFTQIYKQGPFFIL